MEKQQTGKPAVIYCRVATSMVSSRDEAIVSQEKRCRDAATARGYDVVGVFHDIATSGRSADRSGINEMLRFLRDHRHPESVVLVDDLGVLARSAATQLELRRTFRDLGCALETSKARFDDDRGGMLADLLFTARATIEAIRSSSAETPPGRSNFPQRKR